MRNAVALFALLTVAACSNAPADDASNSAAGLASSSGRRVVTLQLDDWPSQMQWLHQNGFDVAGVSIPLQRADVLVSENGLNALRMRGLEIVADKEAKMEPFAAAGPDAQYQTPEKVEAALKAYVAAHPQTTQLKSIGKSIEGRDIWAIEIARDPAHHSPSKPAVLYNGSHHARELMSTEVPLDTVDYLLANDGKDPKVTHWIDANEIWVVPMFNVDGNGRVWTDDVWWRKNASGCKAGVTCESGKGVDLNRNYGFKWAACDGSSTDPSADDYHGPSAESEPETKALEALVAQVRPVFDISYHSYSELVIYPQGCQGVHAAQRSLFEKIGKSMAALLPLDEGGGTYAPGTPWELLYAVDGDDIDWMYHAYNTFAFAIELNSGNQGFQPSYAQWRDKTVTKLRPGWQLLLDRLDQSGVRGVLTGGALAQGTQVQLSTVSGLRVTQTRVVAPDGSFHFIANAGHYNLHVTAPGHAAVDQKVTIGSTRQNVTIPW